MHGAIEETLHQVVIEGKRLQVFIIFKGSIINEWLVLQYGEIYLWGRGLLSFSLDYSAPFPSVDRPKIFKTRQVFAFCGPTQIAQHPTAAPWKPHARAI